MKENNLEEIIDNLNIALKHMENAKKHLEEGYNLLNNKEKKKLKIEINVKNPYEEDIDDEELEQLKKDLEEIMNDFAGK